MATPVPCNNIEDPKEVGNQSQSCNGKRRQKRLYSFKEARKIARAYGFTSQTEFLEYECAGCYQLPKNVETLYRNEWKGWEDFLGVSLSYGEGRLVARKLGMVKKEAYLKLKEEESKTIDASVVDDDLILRLPYRPDLYYKEWVSWEDWLGIN